MNRFIHNISLFKKNNFRFFAFILLWFLPFGVLSLFFIEASTSGPESASFCISLPSFSHKISIKIPQSSLTRSTKYSTMKQPTLMGEWQNVFVPRSL